jgi:NAD+ kinase
VSFPYKTVGIVIKATHMGIDDLVLKIVEWLEKEGSRTICVDTKCDLPRIRPVSESDFQQQSDLILVLGGDGTFLAGGRLAIERNIPILGVNLGRLGFLTEIAVQELFPTLEKIRDGEVVFETRHLLQARIKKEEEVVFEGHVINDAVIAKAAIARLLELETRVDRNFLAVFKADGLIISTPTGSTAYSLAAGGPIVFPTMEAIVMTPICPHSLNHRPLVVPDHLTISVHVQTPAENVSLTLDGQIGRALQSGEYVEIAKSSSHLNIIKSPFKTYFDILKSKLRWGEI